MGQPQTETPAPQTVPASVPYAPAPTTPTVTQVPDAKPKAPKAKVQAWYAKPQIVGVAALIVLILLLLGYRFLGPLVLALVVLVVGVIGFFAALAWRHKSRNAARRAAAGGRTPGGRTGGGVGGSGRTGGRMTALRSKLPQALGGTRGRSTGRTASVGSGRSSRNPFSKEARSARAAKRATRTSSGSGDLTGRRGIFGRKPKANSSGSGRSRGSGGSSKIGGGKFGSRSSSSKPKAKSGPRSTVRKVGNLAKAFWGGVKEGAASKTAATSTPKTGAEHLPGSASLPRPRGAAGQPVAPSKPTQTAPAQPEQQNGPRHSAQPNTTGGSTTMSDNMQYADDQSLQRWGANLGGASQAADEVARLFAEAEAAKARFSEVFGKMATQAESELPTSPTLVADVQSVKVRADQAASSDEWRAVAADAEALPATYRREHETDQDRLDSPRGGIAQEKRADVTTATQDN